MIKKVARGLLRGGKLKCEAAKENKRGDCIKLI
jgi:hypothetical protein